MGFHVCLRRFFHIFVILQYFDARDSATLYFGQDSLKVSRFRALFLLLQ
jgi:hypothetical protein